MSTVADTNKPPVAKTGVKSEAVRGSLRSHLKQTARFIKFMDLMVYGLSWICLILAVWLIASVVDHWLWPLPGLARWAVWCGVVAATAFGLVRYILPLILGRINETYAARRIEKLVPEFKNGLISWLELERIPDSGVPRGVMAALAYRAKRFIGDQDPSATVDTSPVIKLIGGLLLLSTALIAYAIMSPKSVGTTGKRIAFPWNSLASPSRVHFLDIQPGTTILTQGSPLEVNVEVQGLLRDEGVFVRYSTVDGQLRDQVQPLEAVTEGFRYVGSIGTEAEGVQQEIDYWLEAGDAKEGPFRVRINPRPTVVVESVQLTYPAYTKLPPTTLDGNADVQAVEGTTATILARSNQTMRRGILDINPVMDETGKVIKADAAVEMSPAERELTAPWLLRLDQAGTNPTVIEYQVRGFNENLESNARPIVHSMAAIADLAPEITLVGPASRLLKVTPTSEVKLEVRANDPDFGISQIVLQIRKNSKVIWEKPVLENEGATGSQVVTKNLNIASLKVGPGDLVQIIASAKDNRHDPETAKLDPNSVTSEPLMLQVVGPEQQADIPPKNQSTPDDDQSQQPGTQPSEEQNNSPGGESKSQSDSSEGDNESGEGEQQAGGTGAGSEDNAGANEGEQQGQGSGSGSSASSDSNQAGTGGGNQSREQGSKQGSQQQSGDNSSGSTSASGGDQSQSERSQGGAARESGNNSPDRDSQGQRSENNGGGGDQGNSAEQRNGSGEPKSDGEVMQKVRERIENSGEGSANKTESSAQNPDQDPTQSDSNDPQNPGEQQSEERQQQSGQQGQQQSGQQGQQQSGQQGQQQSGQQGQEQSGQQGQEQAGQQRQH
ncbi:MAG: hypothetical protein AB8B50_10635, partial [Pirellulaceae bacterium]